MPEIEVDGARLHYVEAGTGAETVVFSHSYLVDHRHFAAQIEALADRYRVLAYDHRDHGGSQHMAGPYGMEDIYRDGLAFLERVGGGPCHWVGLSTGGFVGLRLAIRRPELLRSLVVMSSTAEPEPWPNRLRYGLLLSIVRFVGFRPVLGEAMKAMFGPELLANPARAADRDEWRRRLQENGRPATVRFGRAIFARDGVEDQLGGIRVPTLVVAGEHDRAIPVERARRTAEGIPNARFEALAGAGHLSTVEQPQAASERLGRFLDGVAAGR